MSVVPRFRNCWEFLGSQHISAHLPFHGLDRVIGSRMLASALWGKSKSLSCVLGKFSTNELHLWQKTGDNVKGFYKQWMLGLLCFNAYFFIILMGKVDLKRVFELVFVDCLGNLLWERIYLEHRQFSNAPHPQHLLTASSSLVRDGAHEPLPHVC